MKKKDETFIPVIKESEATFLDYDSLSSNGSEINKPKKIHKGRISAKSLFEVDVLNSLDKKGKTLLDYVFDFENTQIYDLLVLRGALTSRELLFKAIKSDDIEKIKMYIKSNVNLNLNFLDKYGKTLLDYVTYGANNDMYRLLTLNGAKKSDDISLQSKLKSLTNTSFQIQPSRKTDSSPGTDQPPVRKKPIKLGF